MSIQWVATIVLPVRVQRVAIVSFRWVEACHFTALSPAFVDIDPYSCTHVSKTELRNR